MTVSSAKTKSTEQPKTKAKAGLVSTIREGVETVSFVVALVLMLKLFVVEAFVIPTGSMAETLYGYNKLVVCPSCQFEYPVNSSEEVEPQGGMPQAVAGGCCPNCRYRVRWKNATESPSNRSGDRVLVHKATYHLGEPDRGDVVVFRYPVDPQARFVTNNYIKRLWGLGGETIGIFRGDLYVAKGIEYPADAKDSLGQLLYPRNSDPNRMWEGGGSSWNVSRTEPIYQMTGQDYTYHNTEAAVKRFEQDRAAGFPGNGGFELIRKSNATAMEMRRPVYDNDKQSEYLAKKGVPPRWTAEGTGFKSDSPLMPKVFRHTGDQPGTLRYLHRVGYNAVDSFSAPPLPPVNDQITADQLDDWRLIGQGYSEGLFAPGLIRNVFGYNNGLNSAGITKLIAQGGTEFWVGDLMVECQAVISSPNDEVVLELSKGANRYQAIFHKGEVKVTRTGPGETTFATRPTKLTKAGTYQLRFANVDCRLRVWVNGSALDLGKEADYSPADCYGYSEAVGAIASAAFAPWQPGESRIQGTSPEEIQAMKRSTPTNAYAFPGGMTLQNDLLSPASLRVNGTVEVSQIKLWQDTFFTPSPSGGEFANLDTFYVQPDHYLCLGDNSGQSSDSRAWGVVPKRLMLGKAIFVFFPFQRVGFIR
jgi:signal peptidase I